LTKITDKNDNKILALAGVTQACKQVRTLATLGKYDNDILLTAIHSILNTTPSSTEEVYGKKSSINSGLRIITQYDFNQDSTQRQHDIDLTKTIITTLALSGKLLKRKDLLEKLDKGIEKATKQLEFFPADHNNISANLASLYQETISTMTPKIMITGNPIYLEQADNANRVRTFLLAAVRSGILWHQLGGSRWQLLFQRTKTIKVARRLLQIS
jgi:high frequency lysogenization protein